MNETFYGSPEYNYLKHHGILGMKWGKKNGPPYPLDEKKHDKIVERAEKKLAKKKKAYAKDPEKLKKYNELYSDEEIDTALKRIDKVKEIDKRITPNKKLSARKRALANTPGSLLRYIDKFNPSELELAKKRLKDKEDLRAMKASRSRNKTEKLKAKTDKMKAILDFYDTAVRGKGVLESLRPKDTEYRRFKEEYGYTGLNDQDLYKLYINIKHPEWTPYLKGDQKGEQKGDKKKNK